jgi:hypothetical protein
MKWRNNKLKRGVVISVVINPPARHPRSKHSRNHQIRALPLVSTSNSLVYVCVSVVKVAAKLPLVHNRGQHLPELPLAASLHSQIATSADVKQESQWFHIRPSRGHANFDAFREGAQYPPEPYPLVRRRKLHYQRSELRPRCCVKCIPRHYLLGHLCMHCPVRQYCHLVQPRNSCRY